MSRASHKLVIGLALALAAIVVPLYALKVFHKADYTDFDVYYRAAVRAKGSAFSEVYTLRDGASPFRYAPPVIPFLRPLAELPRTGARMSWYFLQLVFFTAGFAFLFRSLSLLKSAPAIASGAAAPRRGSRARFETALAFLFVLRLCLDTFTIGQVSSLLFLGFCAGLYGFMRRRPWLAGSALFPAALLKIGPAFVYSVFLASRARDRLRAWLAPLLWLGGVCALFWVYSASSGWDFAQAWKSWAGIVANDSVYYDASHYGSQSLKSFLLRLARSGVIGAPAASALWAGAGVAVCLGLFALWTLRRPRTFYGRGLFYSAALFPYFWLMPETFKYSLTGLAIPAALLVHGLSRRPSRPSLSTRFALVFLAASISLPGKDLVGDTLFFGIQRLSLPFFATLALAWAVLGECWRESEVSRAGRDLISVIRFRKIGPWETEPRTQEQATLEYSILAPLPLSARDSIPGSRLESRLTELGEFLEKHPGGELIVVPWGDRLSEAHPSLQAARACAARHRAIIAPPPETDGPGAALRMGFLQSRGRKILFYNLAQPCELSFYARALERLTHGAQLVRGNRRLPESRFRVPVRLLAFVYGRHRLGLGFNRFVRAVLPARAIRTTDTQSGIAALSREFALEAFRLQCSPEFLLELELSLVAALHGAREEELPVRLYLSQEKSKSRMLHETLVILFSLPRLARRVARGLYSPSAAGIPTAVTADDWGMSPAINQGILALARRGVIRRASVMARSAHIDSGLKELKAVPGFELGIHFDLTFGRDSPGAVLKRWVFARLASPESRERLAEEVRRELRAQLDTLERHGIRPGYLDGHHHIHLVPGVLEAIAPLVREAGIRQVRLPLDPGLLATGKIPLLVLSAWARRKLKALGFESLPCFYPAMKHYADYALLREAFRARPSHEVITHPATEDDLDRFHVPDTYGAGRVIEFRALRMLAPPTGFP